MFNGKVVGIIGYGVEGKSTYSFLKKHGIDPLVFDEKKPVDFHGRGHFGPHYLEGIFECDVLFRSPGVNPENPLLQKYLDQGGEITSQVNFFLEHCPTKNTIGVTGTKGKGTTTSLITHILKKWNTAPIYLGGNIGIPMLDFFEELTPESIVVLELSSFQLLDCRFSPHIAVMLNVTCDHLDFHGNVMAYGSAKKSIAAHQKDTDLCVYNDDYPPTYSLIKDSPARKIRVSGDHVLSEGVFCMDGACSISGDGKTQHFLYTKEFGLKGEFNKENIMPAVAVCAEMGVPVELIRAGVRSFTGLPHRLEAVGTLHGSELYNDSFSTVPDTTVAAMHAFDGKTLALIVGGSDKGADFSWLAKEIVTHPSLVHLLVMGTVVGDRIIASIKEENEKLPENTRRILLEEQLELPGDHGALFLSIERTPTKEALAMAVNRVAARTQVVLLSPGCASFDMFTSYKERGDFFRSLAE